MEFENSNKVFRDIFYISILLISFIVNNNVTRELYMMNIQLLILKQNFYHQ